VRQESKPPNVINTDLSTGSVLDEYRIEAQIGWGNVAQVYRATDRRGKTVALKILRPRYAADLEVAARLAREATAVSRIDNPHIVNITRLAECDRGPYFVMEYIEGTALDEILKSEGHLQTPLLLQIALQICEALSAAHDQGVVHRDLKPENMLIVGKVDEAPFVKLIDFGVAKVSINDAIHVASTRPGTIVGSPAYMAPEQIRSLPIDARTDVYGFGVLLYELISGRRPFEGELLQEVLAGHVMRPPPPLSSEGQPVDPRLEALVIRCLAKAPEDRPATMSEVADTLRAIAAELAPEALILPEPPMLTAGEHQRHPAPKSDPAALRPEPQPDPEAVAAEAIEREVRANVPHAARLAAPGPHASKALFYGAAGIIAILLVAVFAQLVC
jgi:serine/threonine-protein kinase